MARLAWFLPLIVLAGCGGGNAPLPSGSDARQALRTALDTWKDGKPASSLSDSKPAIDAVDFEWAAGKKLGTFTIGAESTGTGAKTFSVSITLDGTSPKEVQYMILGRDPLLVYRDEDFNRMLNMEDNPVPPPTNR